jgi:DNA repair protein RecN (Recombination protein N)
VLVITHLPQIAAAAARHLVVAKGTDQGVAQTDVQVAHGEDRVEEIARMLGGSATTARKHAQEMLKDR